MHNKWIEMCGKKETPYYGTPELNCNGLTETEGEAIGLAGLIRGVIRAFEYGGTAVVCFSREHQRMLHRMKRDRS